MGCALVLLNTSCVATPFGLIPYKMVKKDTCPPAEHTPPVDKRLCLCWSIIPYSVLFVNVPSVKLQGVGKVRNYAISPLTDCNDERIISTVKGTDAKERSLPLSVPLFYFL